MGNINGMKQLSKFLVISGALVIWTIKFLVRPMQLFDWPVDFMLGIAPNLLGSFLIPFGACWFFSGRTNLVARVFRLETDTDLRLVCLMGFGMLVINEYLQLIPVFGRTFDYFDIFFSFAGLSLSYFVYGRLMRKMQLV